MRLQGPSQSSKRTWVVYKHLPQNQGTMASKTWKSISSNWQFKNKGRQKPISSTETGNIHPYPGEHSGTGGRDPSSDSPGRMSTVSAAATWSRWLRQAGFDHSFPSGAECLPLCSKGRSSLQSQSPRRP